MAFLPWYLHTRRPLSSDRHPGSTIVKFSRGEGALGDLAYWYWLRDVKGIGPFRCRLLVSAFGSPDRIFDASMQDYLAVGQVGKKLAKSLEDSKKSLDVAKRKLETELRIASRLGARIMTIDERDYPTRLKEQEAVAPIILYILGNVTELPERTIAVVGSRRASQRAQARSHDLAGQFAAKGWGVASGLALGIDTAAHKGALETGGFTIAVVGCGVDVFYPPENRSLQRRIIEEGAVISEYPFGTRPRGDNLRKRNKIIVGLSEAVVVAECPIESGALIAAKEAEDQNKPLFAFAPSEPATRSSEGSWALIRDGRAFGLKEDHSSEDVTTAIATYEQPKVCVLFDLDGVLVDTSAVMIKGYQQAIASILNRRVKSSELRRLLGLSPRAVLRRYSKNRLDELESAYNCYIEEHYASDVRVVRNVRELLARLSDLHVPMGVVTSRNKTVTMKILRTFSLVELMAAVVTWGSTMKRKPHPDPILHALEQMPVSCSEAVYVGDRPEDIQAAQAGEVISVGVSWCDSTSTFDLQAVNPDYLLKTPGQLFELVMSLHRKAWAQTNRVSG